MARDIFELTELVSTKYRERMGGLPYASMTQDEALGVFRWTLEEAGLTEREVRETMQSVRIPFGGGFLSFQIHLFDGS